MDDYRFAIGALLGAWGVGGPCAEQVGRVAAYFELLLRWNARINLTGARRPEELVEDHLVDSLALSALVPGAVEGVDIGAGGGLPGIPFAILRPECRVSLVEPRAKRVAFLRTAVRELRLSSVRVIHGADSSVDASAYDFACSRATFQPVEWILVGMRLVRPGGRVLALSSVAVEAPLGVSLVTAIEYRTAKGARRWAGAFSQSPGGGR